jgi:hypothetical protein
LPHALKYQKYVDIIKPALDADVDNEVNTKERNTKTIIELCLDKDKILYVAFLFINQFNSDFKINNLINILNLF